MFTGIIEATGTVGAIENHGSNTTFWIASGMSSQFKIDQSVSHSGVCLTIEEVDNNRHRVTAISETLKRTNLSSWEEGTIVNLEQSLLMNGRLDGHIVQGHVDTVATCIEKNNVNGSWEYTFNFDPQFAGLVIEKGSISLNGISLTIFNIGIEAFTIAIIPYTFEHTNIQQVERGTKVNIEFDMVGKYIARLNSLK